MKRGSPHTQGTHGLLAEFDTPAAILEAAAAVRDAGFSKWDVFTPHPVRGLDSAMGLKNSPVGWFAFLAGTAGFIGGMWMVWYMNKANYPVPVGGKPLFSPFSAFLVAFELTILLAAFGAFFGMLYLNGLPRLHHPVLKHARFALASRDRYFLVIESADQQYDETRTRRLLEELGGKPVESVNDD